MTTEIIPEKFPYDLKEKPLRFAESKVYHALKEQLGNEFTIFYNTAWSGQVHPDGSFEDGEADFIILWKDKGYLSLEVKGGGIGYDLTAGKWFSQNRNGERNFIKDPFEQAKRSKHFLLNKLKSHPAFVNQRICMAHAVIFPDVSRNGLPNQVSYDPKLIMTNESMPHIAKEIKDIFQIFLMNQNDSGLSNDNVSILKSILSKSFYLKPLLSVQIENTEQQLLELTKAQYKLLNNLSRNRRMVVSGSAGTGKTLLAIEKARRLASEGINTLFVCYNKPLANHIRVTMGKIPNLSVYTFHELCYYFEKMSNPDHRPFKDDQEETDNFFNEVLPSRYLDALGNTPIRFGSIIVDEAQDFYETWRVPLELSLSHRENALFYIFYDENQNIYGRKLKLPFTEPSFHLADNLRNSNQIFNFAMKFYEGQDIPCSSGVDGSEVSVIEVKNEKQTILNELNSLIRKLTTIEKIPINQIAILTCSSTNSSVLSGSKNLGPYKITNDHHDSNGILFESVRRFKGLERPVVIIIDIEMIQGIDRTRILYMGFTRPRSQLYVFVDSIFKRDLV